MQWVEGKTELQDISLDQTMKLTEHESPRIKLLSNLKSQFTARILNYASPKYYYVCKNCGLRIGRHSKSIKVETQLCKMCGGKFELLQQGVTKTKITPNKFALFVKEHYKNVRIPGMTHAEAMQLLSKKFNKD